MSELPGDIIPFMRLPRRAEFALLNSARPGPAPPAGATPDEITQFVSGLAKGFGGALVNVQEGVSRIADTGILVGKAFAAGSAKFGQQLSNHIQDDVNAWRSNPVGELRKVLRDFTFEQIA